MMTAMNLHVDEALIVPQEPTPDTPAPDAPPPPPPKKKGRHTKKIVAAAIALVLVASAVILLLPGSSSQAAGDTVSYIEHTVQRRDITVSLSGSGALQPADSYTVTSLVEGEILSDGFEEGDTVEKDAFLYEIDSADLSADIQRAENSLSQSRKSYERKLGSLEDLTIQAPQAGTVVELNVEVGDKVSAGQLVAVIRETGAMRIKLPFVSDDAQGFYVGQSATVTIDGTFEQLSGTVSKISAVDELYQGSLPVRYVTIEVPNPGGLSLTRSASAVVGDIACSGPGTFEYMDEKQVTAETSGEVSSLGVQEGSRVSKGDTLARLVSDNLDTEIENAENSLEDAQISLQNQYDKLDNYSITSPISGTIIEKYYKAGDNAETGKSLCVIYDLSYLTMTLNVDELDVSTVAVGQEVTVTADAVSGKTYTGVVTKVSVAGTTSGGVTTYPVTIRIDETDGLLPGMNVEAEILVMNRENVLAVPVAAVSRGDRILVKTGDTDATDGTSGTGTTDTSRPTGEEMPTGFDPENLPEGFDPEYLPEGFDPENLPEGFTPPDSQGAAGDGQALTVGSAGPPEGFEYVTVTLGESDGSYIEVLDGLSEGDVIAYAQAAATGTVNGGDNAFGFGNMGSETVVVMPADGGAMPAGGSGFGPGGRQ